MRTVLKATEPASKTKRIPTDNALRSDQTSTIDLILQQVEFIGTY